jgi:hypothetical protein
MPTKIGKFTVLEVDKGEPANPCGECTVCCTVLSIDDGDFHKEAGVDCQHLCKSGCGIYPTRPSLCSTYYCMYAVLDGFLRAGDRPDIVKVLVTMSHQESHFSRATGIPLFAAYELVPDGFKSYNGNRIIKKFATRVVLALITNDRIKVSNKVIDDNTEFIGPNRYLPTVAKYRSTLKDRYGK